MRVHFDAMNGIRGCTDGFGVTDRLEPSEAGRIAEVANVPVSTVATSGSSWHCRSWNCTSSEVHAMLKYQAPATPMTLRAALTELRQAEGDVSQEVSEQLATALEAHDVVHIIFGLDISDLDEVVAHGWMAFRTTLTMSKMHVVTRDRDHQRHSNGFAHGKKGMLILRALPRLIGALFQSFRMTKRWPWEQYTDYLDVPLIEIRREFGIKLTVRRRTPERPRGPQRQCLLA